MGGFGHFRHQLSRGCEIDLLEGKTASDRVSSSTTHTIFVDNPVSFACQLIGWDEACRLSLELTPSATFRTGLVGLKKAKRKRDKFKGADTGEQNSMVSLQRLHCSFWNYLPDLSTALPWRLNHRNQSSHDFHRKRAFSSSRHTGRGQMVP